MVASRTAAVRASSALTLVWRVVAYGWVYLPAPCGVFSASVDRLRVGFITPGIRICAVKLLVRLLLLVFFLF